MSDTGDLKGFRKRCDNCDRRHNGGDHVKNCRRDPTHGNIEGMDGDGAMMDLCSLCIMNMTVVHQRFCDTERRLEKENAELRQLLTELSAAEDYRSLLDRDKRSKHDGGPQAAHYNHYHDTTRDILRRTQDILRK